MINYSSTLFLSSFLIVILLLENTSKDEQYNRSDYKDIVEVKLKVSMSKIRKSPFFVTYTDQTRSLYALPLYRILGTHADLFML